MVMVVTYQNISYVATILAFYPTEPYFKGFSRGISNIFYGIYLTYHPSHRVLIHLKSLTVYIYIKP